MKNSLSRFIIRGLGLLLMTIALMQVFAPEFAASIFGSSSAFALASVGASAGEIDTSSTDRDRVKPDISNEITIVRPDMFRLDTALRKIKSKPAFDVEVKWEEVGQRPRIALISAAANTVAAPEVTITLATALNSTYFIVNDVARVMNPATNTDHPNFTGIRLVVTGRNDTNNTITVRAYNNTGFVDVPIIPALAFGSALNVVRVGHIKTEKDGVGSAVSQSPIQKSNYVHTLEKFISISKMRQKLKTYTKDDFIRNIEQGIYDLRLDAEGLLWDGVGMSSTFNNDKIHSMKGFSSYVTTNVITLPSVGSLTESWLLDVGEQVSASVHGSEEKMLYVSPSLWTELSKLNLVNGTLQNTRQERILGSYATRVNTGHCEFLIANHKGFPELGKQRFGAVVDMANICKRVLEPMSSTVIDPEGSGGARTTGKKYLETFTLEVRNEETHALLV